MALVALPEFQKISLAALVNVLVFLWLTDFLDKTYY